MGALGHSGLGVPMWEGGEMNKREWMLQAALAGLNGGLGLNPIGLTVAHLGALYDAICAASPETPQEGVWVEHDGDVSKAPMESAEVVVELRSGYMQEGHRGGDFAWDHDGDGSDIVRWRYA